MSRLTHWILSRSINEIGDLFVVAVTLAIAFGLLIGYVSKTLEIFT